MVTKYADLLTDTIFKKVFASEPNKILLIALLNAVFRGHKQITDLTYCKNEHPGDTDEIGGAIFDLLCTGSDGKTFLIEVQRTGQENLKQRMLFYAGKLISDSAPKGKRAAWNYGIPEIYVIIFMDGFRFPESREGHYLHDICLCNRENGEVFYEGLEFIYIELLNFVKTLSGMETDLDRWLFLFRNISTLDSIPEAMRNNPVFESVFENAEYVKLTKKEKEMYDIELKRRWDRANILASATKQARAEGWTEGKAEGKEEVVVTGWKNGFTFEQLCTLTGWEKERVTEVLKREHLL